MGFIAVLPILLFLPHIPIIPEEAMYPSVEKKPRTTRWPLRGPIMDPEQLGIPQYVENLFGLEPPRLHLPLQPLYVETLLLLHRAGPTNSGEGPRTEVGGGESTELRRRSQRTPARRPRTGAGWRVARAPNIRRQHRGEVGLEWPGRRQLPPRCLRWVVPLVEYYTVGSGTSKQAITRHSPEVVLVGRAEQRHQLFQ